MLLAYKIKQTSLLEEIREKGEMDDALFKRNVQLNNDFKKSLLTPITVASFEPTYDTESNITSEEITLGTNNHTRSYTFDDENQLLTATYSNKTYTYTYDERNNRLTQRIQTTTSDTTDYYTYNKEDELTAWERRNTQNQNVL